MIKLDLVTGFLGSGKTTFIIEYVRFLHARGERVAVVVNDHGAINVDRMLIEDAVGDICHVEMVIGGDIDCHKRRLKTKLISLALGMGEIEDGTEVSVGHFDRVIIEPSGIFDTEEFFNLIYEAPLTKWYEIGNVITLVNAEVDGSLSKESRYMIASQSANAGMLLVTHLPESADSKRQARETLAFVNDCLEEFRCDRRLEEVLCMEPSGADEGTMEKIASCGYVGGDLLHLPVAENGHFESKFFFHLKLPEETLCDSVREMMQDPSHGDVIRLKGFQQKADGTWIEVNATRTKVEIKPIATGQEVYILISEHK